MQPRQQDLSAFDVIRQELPRWWADPSTKDLREGLSYVVPTNPTDAGMMLMAGPGGKLARKAGAAMLASGTGDAEAGNLIPAVLTGMKKHLPALMDDLRKGASRMELFKKYGLFPISHESQDVVEHVATPARARRTISEKGDVQARVLSDYLDHPELFSRVPNLKDIPVIQLGDKIKTPGANGLYYASTTGELLPRGGIREPLPSTGLEAIMLSKNANSGKSLSSHWDDVPTTGGYSLLDHEANHALQARAKAIRTPHEYEWPDRVDEITASFGAQDVKTPQLIDELDYVIPLGSFEGGVYPHFAAPSLGSPRASYAATSYFNRLADREQKLADFIKLSRPAEGYAKGGLVHDVTKAKIIPERTGPNLLTREYPKLSGFLQGLMGRAPDEVGGGSVLDEDAQSSRKLQALGAKYGFPIGTLAGMLPFGGGIAKAPSVAAGSRTAQRGIIKAPGGNWLSGSAEDAVRGLKVQISPTVRDDTIRSGYPWSEADEAALASDSAVNNWIDSQLVKKYIKNEMATERDPLRLMADAWPAKKAARLAEVQSRIDALAERTRQLARERGQPEHTLTEMRQLMIPLEKEKALIEATEGLHVRPDQLYSGQSLVHPSGEALQKLGRSPEAKAWENASDRMIAPEQARTFLHTKNGETGIPTVARNPWLAKVPPETPVYDLYAHTRPEDIGFNHLIDELRNSLNPESGLPKELLMRYQDLPKVTVPQAAERVAQINAWRAAQKREADLLTANNAATVLHKDYPEKGLKWVEMKAPERTVDNIPESFRKEYEYQLSRGFTPEQALAEIKHDITSPELEAALKYEGDQMAHCVGGYCPDVLEGRSRIFSLRDAKGKPHTTIEVAPWRSSQGESLAQFEARLRADPNRSEEAVRQIMSTPRYTDSIKQIKGFKNGKPDDEYLPYVQDFVRSGKWSDVGDLENSGLLRASNQVYQHPRDAGEGWMPRFGDLGIDEGYYTNDELVGHIQAARKKAGYASGGLVNVGYNPAFVNARAAQLEAELFN